MTANIFIVEDHPFMRRMLCEFLDWLPGVTVCGTASSACQALTALTITETDLVLVDVALPDLNGIELVRLVQQWQAPPPCLIYSSYEELAYIQQAFEAGACGYLFKRDPLELADALRRVLAYSRHGAFNQLSSAALS